jgi:hypothetical protein
VVDIDASTLFDAKHTSMSIPDMISPFFVIPEPVLRAIEDWATLQHPFVHVLFVSWRVWEVELIIPVVELLKVIFKSSFSRELMRSGQIVTNGARACPQLEAVPFMAISREAFSKRTVRVTRRSKSTKPLHVG